MKLKLKIGKRPGPEGSNSQRNRSFKRSRARAGWNEGKHPAKKQQKRHVNTVGVNTMGYAKALHGALGVARLATDRQLPKVTWNNQGDTQRSGVENNVAAQRGCPPAVTSSRGSRNKKKPHAEGRIFCKQGEKTEEAANIVSVILLVNQLYAPILFVSTAICSFVNSIFAKKLVSKRDEMHVQAYVTSPLGTVYHIDLIFRDCTVNIGEKALPIDLVQLENQG